MKLFNSLPTGFKRLLVVGYLALVTYAIIDDTAPDYREKAVIGLLVSAEYWGAVLIILWVINGFRNK